MRNLDSIDRELKFVTEVRTAIRDSVRDEYWL